MERLRGLGRRLFAPVDIASLVFFRVCFGALMMAHVGLYFSHGWIRGDWLRPQFHFTYYGFGWVKPWPGHWLYVHMAVLGVLGFFIMIGLCCRLSAFLFFLGFTYTFLLDELLYQNHYYLICLLAALLAVLPAHRRFSVDAWLRPESAQDAAPAWTLYLLRAQIGLPYFFGGVAKLNGDWVRGEPLRLWMRYRVRHQGYPPFFAGKPMVCFLSHAGLALDLSLVPLLLLRRTRPWAAAAAVCFHLANSGLFDIGVFPWLMIAGTLLFFPPEWPRELLRRFRRSGAEGEALRLPPAPRHRTATAAALAAYLLVQLGLPLRHFLYPGATSWTEEGHRYAWRMKLRDKYSKARFRVVDPASGREWLVRPSEVLADWQADDMGSWPDMILQFAHHLADLKRQEGYDKVRVYASVSASLNGRRPQPLIDPSVDLAAQPRTLGHAAWIVPLAQPLPPDRFASR